jgi:hypothetical protein
MNNIDTSSSEKFYESYKNYFINLYKDFNKKQDHEYHYVFFCRDSKEIFCIKGYSMEHIYYKILFEIDYNSCDDIYVYEYSLDELKDPIELLKNHYFDNQYYVFEEIKYNNYNNYINNNININPTKINKKTKEQFYESYEQYYLYYYNKKLQNINNNNYRYIFISCEYAEIFFIEGKTMEKIYYIILFKLNKDLLYEIYDRNYSIKELKDPIKLLVTDFLETDEYIFNSLCEYNSFGCEV